MDQGLAAPIQADIPVIDLGPLATEREGAFYSVGGAIRAAATSVDFFYVKNHGVPISVIEAAAAVGREFFDSPGEPDFVRRRSQKRLRRPT